MNVLGLAQQMLQSQCQYEQQQGLLQQYHQGGLAQQMGSPATSMGMLSNQNIYGNNQVTKRGIMKAFKDYLTEHKDVIFTLMICLLVDHFVFQDAFKEKIMGSLNKLLDRAHEKIGA